MVQPQKHLAWVCRIGRRRAMQVLVCGLVGLVAVAGSNPVMAAGSSQDTLWTTFTPSEDTRLIFVSSSDGHDSNSGFNPSSPVRTLARGYELLREGKPDWLLLRRGDVWVESFPNWAKSGRGEDEKLVVGAYGEASDRPQVRPPGGSNAIQAVGGPSYQIRHVAFVGLHLEPETRAVDQSPLGIRWVRGSKDILLEDLYISSFKDNIILQGIGDGVWIENVRVNGCVVVDSWSSGSHSQGLYARQVNGLQIENSVFIGNGFNFDMGANPTIFNHNLYIQHGNQNVEVRRNIIADASSHGIQLRPGGIIEDNLFLSNPINIWVSATEGMDQQGVTNIVARNLIMYGRDLSPEHPRRFGIEVANLDGGVIEENILYSAPDGSNGQALQIKRDRGIRDVAIRSNWFIDWNGTIAFQAPSSTSFVTGLEFVGNRVYRDWSQSSRPLIELFADHAGSIQFSQGSYHVRGMPNSLFRLGGAVVDAGVWTASVEPDAGYTQVAGGLPDISLDRYMAHIGRSGGLEEFLGLARTMSRQNPLPQVRPTHVYGWARNQLP